MSDQPKRIQRRRSKGWRMPDGCVYVGRPTKWGNPWSIDGYWDAGYSGSAARAAEVCVEQFRAWLTGTRSSWTWDIPVAPWALPGVPESAWQKPDLAVLRGKDLACWCPLVDKDGKPVPCHADVLLELANREPQR
jgi:hypothetical protein